jgi:pyruvate formate-lyase activating enzyme-like uncharacterized protein
MHNEIKRFKEIGIEIKALSEESRLLRTEIAKQVESSGNKLNEVEFTEINLDELSFRIKKAVAHKDYTIIFGEKPAGILPYEG